MLKNNITLLTALFLILSGCGSTLETVEKKEPVSEVTVRMDKAEVLKIPEKREDAKPSGGIAEETLYAHNAYTPEEGDTVYATCHTNIMRYIPLRSTPSNSGKVLKAICIGSELGVLAVQDRWIQVKGVDENFSGWIPAQWVTEDRAVKIDADRRRKERAPEISRLEAIVKPIPQSDWRENLRLYQKLLELDPCSLYYQGKVDFYGNYGRGAKRSKRK